MCLLKSPSEGGALIRISQVELLHFEAAAKGSCGHRNVETRGDLMPKTAPSLTCTNRVASHETLSKLR